MSDAEYTGPLNFAVFALPQGADFAGVTAEVTQLAASHRAEILDVELISRASDGSARLEPLPAELAAAETDLLQADDLAVVAEDLVDGELALVVVYEDRTLASLASQIASVSGRELWAGGIDVADVEALETDADSAGAVSES